MRSVRTHLARTAITAVTAVVASLLIATVSAPAAMAASVHSAPGAAAVASTGTISGVISQPKSGKTVPLNGAQITLTQVVGASRISSNWASTDTSGKFSFAGIEAGTYTIGVRPPYDSDLAPQWWGNKGTLASASTFSVAAGKSVTANVTLAVGAKISGTVKSPTGVTTKPIYATATDLGGGWAGSAPTNATGSYVIKGLAAGSYKVQFTDYGSPTSAHEPLVSEWWDNQPSAAKANAIAVKAGQVVSGKNAVLEFGGRISGTVTQSVGGVSKPISSVPVALLDASGAVISTQWTATNGKYEFYGLKASGYKVRVSPSQNSGYASLKDQYWPNSSTLAGASTATVVSKKAKTGVDFKYVVTPKVTLSAPTITGTLKVGATLKAAANATQTGVTFSYQWYAAGVKIAGATKSSLVLTSAQAGQAIAVKVTGAKAAYTSVTIASASTAKIVSTAIPTITGTAKVGATLTAKPGAWTTGVKLAYQWYANGAAISGATASTFVATTAQAAKAVTVGVTSAQAGYASVTEKSTMSVKPARTTVPTITGTVKVGATLTAVPGTWTTGSTLKYQWYAADVALAGASKSTLLLSSAHVGKAITVKVTGALAGYPTLTETSKATAKPIATAIPTITGTAKVGATLTAKPGAWTSGVKLAYQWYANGAVISGATGSTFVVTSAQAGTAITVGVTSAQAGYAAVTEKSTTSVKPARTSVPTITGTAKVGNTLTAATGTWTAGTAFSYQWFADAVAISGATKSSLVLASAQDGKAVTVKVTGSLTGLTTFAETSAATLKTVSAVTPTITGTAKVGATLTAKSGAWTTGVKLAYQWYANGAAISGATGSTFVVTSAQAGSAITFAVTSAQSGYAAVTEKSTTSVKPALTAVPTITGTAKTGETLTAAPGVWTEGTTFSYEWFADGVAIPDGTAQALVLDADSDGRAITVKVTGTLTGYATFSETSNATLKVISSAVPMISGDAMVGATLTAESGSWSNGVTVFSYQWFADGVEIEGATAGELVVTPEMIGRSISVGVTGTLDGYTTIQEISVATAPVVGVV